MVDTFLALGDSYTIGEAVLLHESFPYQTIQLLRSDINSKRIFAAPEIIAKTGWTTDELLHGIESRNLLSTYNWVSLLIGVNNQYRGKSISEFENDFEVLLKKAIQFAGGNPSHVFVLSIPDWGRTTYAKERNAEVITKEIDAFNAVCGRLSNQYKINFIDITESQRTDAEQDGFVAEDGLHPSGKEYAKWAIQLSKGIQDII